MSTGFIKYKSGYKYQLAEKYVEDITIKPKNDIVTFYITLNSGGTLRLRKGYAWDGPSGPTFDTRNFMRGSVVHDALYQLMREGHLNPDDWREAADDELKRLCLQDGMSKSRAWWVHKGVRWGGKKAATGPAKEVKTAPKQE